MSTFCEFTLHPYITSGNVFLSTTLLILAAEMKYTCTEVLDIEKSVHCAFGVVWIVLTISFSNSLGNPPRIWLWNLTEWSMMLELREVDTKVSAILCLKISLSSTHCKTFYPRSWVGSFAVADDAQMTNLGDRKGVAETSHRGAPWGRWREFLPLSHSQCLAHCYT